MNEIPIALTAAVLIPVLSALWSRRRKRHAETARSVIFGLLILAAAIECFHCALSLPMSIDDELPDMLLALLRIFLFAAGAFGVMAGAAIIWEAFKAKRV